MPYSCYRCCCAMVASFSKTRAASFVKHETMQKQAAAADFRISRERLIGIILLCTLQTRSGTGSGQALALFVLQGTTGERFRVPRARKLPQASRTVPAAPAPPPSPPRAHEMQLMQAGSWPKTLSGTQAKLMFKHVASGPWYLDVVVGRFDEG